MTILRYPARKRNGLPSGDYWYIANEYSDGTFTITLNRDNALRFATESAADAFNQRQLQRGHLSAPFKITNL